MNDSVALQCGGIINSLQLIFVGSGRFRCEAVEAFLREYFVGAKQREREGEREMVRLNENGHGKRHVDIGRNSHLIKCRRCHAGAILFARFGGFYSIIISVTAFSIDQMLIGSSWWEMQPLSNSVGNELLLVEHIRLRNFSLNSGE